jgi:hypothetical protein
LVGGERLADKEGNLKLRFMDKKGKFFSLAEVESAELAKGLEEISQEIATRLRLQKEQR